MKKLLRNKKGFTLIELIVVILILAILAAILVPSILNYVQEANDSAAQANARSVYSEIAVRIAANQSIASGVYTPPGGCTFEGTTIETLRVTCDGFTFDGQTMTP